MGTKNKPGDFDCYEAADPDEPMFVLLARDVLASDLVYEWARRREVVASIGDGPDEREAAKIAEARACADAMRDWHGLKHGIANISVRKSYPTHRPERDHSERRWRVRYNLAYDGGGSDWVGCYRTLLGAKFAVWWNRNVASWGGSADLVDTRAAASGETT